MCFYNRHVAEPLPSAIYGTPDELLDISLEESGVELPVFRVTPDWYGLMAVSPLWRPAWAMLLTYHICTSFLVLCVYSVRNSLVLSSTFYVTLDFSRHVPWLRMTQDMLGTYQSPYAADSWWRMTHSLYLWLHVTHSVHWTTHYYSYSSLTYAPVLHVYK